MLLSRRCLCVAVFVAASSVLISTVIAQPPTATPAKEVPRSDGAAEFDRINAERDPMIDTFNTHYNAEQSAEALVAREKVIPVERRLLELVEARFPGDTKSRRIVAGWLFDSLTYTAQERMKIREFAASEKQWAAAEAVAAAEFGADGWQARECRLREETAKVLAGGTKEQQDAYFAGQAAMIQTVTLLGENKIEEAAAAGEAALESITKAMGDEHFEVGTCLNNMGMVRGRQSKPDEAATLFVESAQILRKSLGEHPTTARSLANHGLSLLRAEKYAEAEPLVRAGYEMRKATVGPDDSTTADSAYGLGVVLFELGRPRESIPLFTENLRFLRENGGENSPQAAACLRSIGRAALQIGETADGVQCLEKAVSIYRDTFGEEHMDTMVSLAQLADGYSAMGDSLKASACLEQAVAVGRTLLKPDHPYLAVVLNDLGVAYLNTKAYGKAMPNLEEALAIRKKVFGDGHDVVRVSLANLGIATRDKGDFAKAEPLLEQALVLAEKLHGPDSVPAGNAAFALAGLSALQNNVDQAEKRYLDALARFEKAGSRQSSLGARSELAKLYETHKKFAKAREQLEAAHAMGLELFGPSAPFTQQTAQRLRAVYERTGDKDKLAAMVTAAKGGAGAATSANAFKQIGLAMMNYHDAKGTYPAAGSTTVKGASRLSWRVHILPYLGDGSAELYAKSHLDAPWDSEHNSKLVAEMPEVFKTKGVDVPPGKTLYLVVAGPDGLFGDGAKGPKMTDILDGMSNTLMLVEVDPDAAVEWTRPGDWQFDVGKPFASLGKIRNGEFQALFADGSVRKLEAAGDADKFKAVVTPRGGEVVEIE